MKPGVFVFTGDREWTDKHSVAAQLANIRTKSFGQGIIITGGARGLDTIAWEMAVDLGLCAPRIDAAWDFFGKRAGPVRNQWMLDIALALMPTFGPVKVLAFHKDIGRSRGTADMLGRCQEYDIDHELFSV